MKHIKLFEEEDKVLARAQAPRWQTTKELKD